MCGVFGYFNRDGQDLNPRFLRSMGHSIHHRGPDDQGIYTSNGVALGNQRLSIIDVEGGHQPFISDDGQVVVVQNGEIYNHIELAEHLSAIGNPCRTFSDTEVLLRLYESEGIQFLSRLNGMFAFAIYDRRLDALYLARDRIGVKPLYIYDDGVQLIFGSEIKAILNSDIPLPEINYEAIHHYLSFNYVPAPFTLYQGINHLMPGHLMTITRTKTEVVRWWDLSKIQPVFGKNESEWIEEFNSILDDAVRLRMRCDVPFGAFLSGGVDSSSVVGLMARHAQSSVKTFCIGFDDPRFDESGFALYASERFGTDHRMECVDPDMLELWSLATYHCDQAHGDISFLPTYKVSKLASHYVKVVLTGDGADELFAGYDKYKIFFSNPDSTRLQGDHFRRSYFNSISLFDHNTKNQLYSERMRKLFADCDSFDVAKPWMASVSHQDRVNQALFLDMQLLLSGNNLVKPDRMGMAVSLEARTPFLDFRMMELAFKIPGGLKLCKGETKYLYKKAVAPLIGENLAYRKKQMFTVPVGEWFRGSKARFCEERLDILVSSADIFDINVLRSILEQHVTGARNMTREIRAFISLSYWLESYILK